MITHSVCVHRIVDCPSVANKLQYFYLDSLILYFALFYFVLFCLFIYLCMCMCIYIKIAFAHSEYFNWEHVFNYQLFWKKTLKLSRKVTHTYNHIESNGNFQIGIYIQKNPFNIIESRSPFTHLALSDAPPFSLSLWILPSSNLRLLVCTFPSKWACIVFCSCDCLSVRIVICVLRLSKAVVDTTARNSFV